MATTCDKQNTLKEADDLFVSIDSTGLHSVSRPTAAVGMGLQGTYLIGELPPGIYITRKLTAGIEAISGAGTYQYQVRDKETGAIAPLGAPVDAALSAENVITPEAISTRFTNGQYLEVVIAGADITDGAAYQVFEYFQAG